MSEKDDFFSFVYVRMLENLRADPMYQRSLTAAQVAKISQTPPAENWIKDNEVRQLMYGKFVPLMTAFEIRRQEVDRQLHERNMAQERYSTLRWQVDRLIQFINITITGDMDARVLQKAIQQTIEELSLNSSNNIKEESKQ